MRAEMNDQEDMDVKLSKLNDLKELIYDLLADGYSDKEVMEEVQEAVAGEPSSMGEEKAEMMAGDSGMDEGEEDPLMKLKRDYFKPKPAASRNGTGVFIAAMSQKQAPKKMEDMASKPGKMGKMK
jgi:hypothetical protein